MLFCYNRYQQGGRKAYEGMRGKKTETTDQLVLVHETATATSKEKVFTAFGDTLHDANRIQYPNAENTAQVIETIAEFKLQGGFVAMVDGAFDVPHPQHEWYLRHCRLAAAEQMLIARGEPTSDFMLRAALESDDVKLIVTLDADEKINRKKGGNKDKGGVPRPIYPWRTRADRLAGYMFNGQSNLYKPVVDLVTVEGDDTHINTPLESSLTLAEHLAQNALLDCLVIFGEHQDAVEQAQAMLITPIVIPEGLVYECDPRTGEPWHSSTIIKSMQATAVQSVVK